MAEGNWFWAEGEKQSGPAPLVTVARLIAAGALGAQDLVWQEGMPDWVPVQSVPALVKYLNVTAVAASGDPAMAVQNSPGAVGYYNPSGTLPPRAALALRRHAQPRGDVGDWPLDDDHVSQFDAGWKLRKQILSAASLFRMLLYITAIGDVFVLLPFLMTLGSSRRLAPAMAGFGVATLAIIALSVLYYFAWKATVRSQAWAPLTMGIVFVILGLLNLLGMARAASGSPEPSWIAGIIPLLFAAGFAYVSFRAYSAIPKYLQQPAWVQELLSKSEK